MENKVRQLREQKNLTQTELAQKSSLSLRTIQRIESGAVPKGFTLRAISESLEVDSQSIFHEVGQSVERAKLINLSALSGMIVPFADILVPLFLTYKTQDPRNKEIGKRIVITQIALTIVLSLLMIICPFVQRAIAIKFPIFIIVLIGFLVLRIFVIVTNGIHLKRNGQLRIALGTNIL
ncbi:MAG: helix-turn-helix domain-containing protein [Cytophagaceae bacterium]|nr:MAG: helix-turn-helix domain-containing protein [Cytophagaceae bacterium]